MNAMLKLYRFRPLGDDESCRRVKTILKTGEFWLSSLWNMNDPMEGIFTDEQNNIPSARLNEIFSEKNNKRICCFSSEEAFKSPIMWGYYANGFKGVAIEIEVALKDVHKVTYENSIASWNDKISTGLSVNNILTTKLNCWRHEGEYRYICDSAKDGPMPIGKINAVHFGWPYSNVENAKSIFGSAPNLRNYVKRVRCLIDVANTPKINTYAAQIDGQKVVSRPFSKDDIDKVFGKQAVVIEGVDK